MDSNAVFAILLLIVGLGILTAEIFVPSGGLLGVITFFTLIISLIFAYRAWGTSHPNIFGAFCVMILLLVPTVIGFGFYMLPRTSFGKRIMLEAPEEQALVPFSQQTQHFERLIGHFGSTVTMLNPGGIVIVEGERLHALSEGLSIDPGTSVEVVEIRGTSVVVRPGMAPVEESNDKEVAEPVSGNPSLLDFELPPET
jgi:membrane-bound serine protease (ClpP class)